MVAKNDRGMELSLTAKPGQLTTPMVAGGGRSNEPRLEERFIDREVHSDGPGMLYGYFISVI